MSLKSPILRQEDIPDQIVEELVRASEVNSNYQIQRLSADVQSDISRALYGKDGTPTEGARRKDLVDAVCISIHSRVSQIRPEAGQNKLWERRTRGESPKIFRASRRETSKSVQEVLTHPADYVILTENDPTTDHEILPDLIIDPSRISDSVLMHLGLEKVSGTPAQKMEQRASAVPMLKELFHHLEPIQVSLPAAAHTRRKRHAYRLFRVAEGAHKGMIIGAQQFSGKEGIFFTDLHGADRRFKKIEQQNPKEKEELVELCQSSGEIDNALEQWITSKEKPANMEDLLARLDQLTGQFLYVQNKWKVKILSGLEKARALLSQATPNPTAARACINSGRIQTLAAERIAEIDSIASTLGRDKSTLAGRIKHESGIAEKLYITFNRNKSFVRAATTHPPREELLASMSARLAAEISQLQFHPYKVFGDAIKLALDKQDFASAYTYSKFARIWHVLMRIYENFSMAEEEGIDTVHISQFLEKMRNSIGIEEMFPGHIVENHQDAWDKIQMLYSRLDALIGMYATAQQKFIPSMKKDHKKKYVNSAKRDIKDLDLPGIVAGLAVK